MQNVINYGEVGDKFYIMLKGIASVIIPNSAIKDRAVKWREYKSLLEW